MKLSQYQLELFESLTEKYPDFPIKGITFKLNDNNLLNNNDKIDVELNEDIIKKKQKK